MIAFLECFDAEGRPLLGTDYGAVLRQRTARGRARAARAMLQSGGGWRLRRVASARVSVHSEERKYGPALALESVDLKTGNG